MNGTAFYRTNLPLKTCFYAVLLFANSSSGIRSSFLRKQLGIGPKAAHRLGNQIRLHMATQSRPVKLGGRGKTVEVDELFLKHARADIGSPLETRIVMGFFCEGEIRSVLIPDRRSGTLLSAISSIVEPGSRIITDQWCGYRRIPSLGFEHISVNHEHGFFDYAGNSTCNIDSYWASVRRALRSYQQVKSDNMWLYLAEIEFKYNRRRTLTSPFQTLMTNWPRETESQIMLRTKYDLTSMP